MFKKNDKIYGFDEVKAEKYKGGKRKVIHGIN